ncbi:MAG: putative DNA-binding domain-containing protein [Halieaceae bacterium]
MAESALRETQLGMARFLRNPHNEPAPEGVEARRLKIYQDLIYNNIEGFISGGFPVLRSLYDDPDWHELVRLFIDNHRCHSPYFLEISQEFLRFLGESFEPRDCDPPFMTELAHYEWVELALDVAEEELPPLTDADVLNGVVTWSPLAWLLSYSFPVHRIGPAEQPGEAGEPSYLVVYRNHEDKVKFMELNAATARLAELIRDNQHETGRVILTRLAEEMGMTVDAILDFGAQQLNQFQSLGVALVSDAN